MNTSLPKKKKQLVIEQTPRAAQKPKKVRQKTKPFPPAPNARLIWAQEAGSTTEPQGRH